MKASKDWNTIFSSVSRQNLSCTFVGHRYGTNNAELSTPTKEIWKTEEGADGKNPMQLTGAC